MASGEERELYTVPEAAKELGKPHMTLYRWINADKLIAIRLGGILFVPVSEVERLKQKINEQAAEA
ncbi:hypothetical protein ES707_05722 [subsurface metagenome]